MHFQENMYKENYVLCSTTLLRLVVSMVVVGSKLFRINVIDLVYINLILVFHNSLFKEASYFDIDIM